MTLTKTVDQMTILQGDRPRLKNLLKARLIECGWTDQVRLLCRECYEDHGPMNVDALVQKVTPKARQLVPDTIKKELLQKIKYILQNHDQLNTINNNSNSSGSNGNNNNNNNNNNVVKNNVEGNAADGPSGGGGGGGSGINGSSGGGGGGIVGTITGTGIIGDGDGEGDIDAYAEIIRNANDNVYRYVNEDHQNWVIEQQNRVERNGIEIDVEDDCESIADSIVM